jgi:hypothetical protein
VRQAPTVGGGRGGLSGMGGHHVVVAMLGGPGDGGGGEKEGLGMVGDLAQLAAAAHGVPRAPAAPGAGPDWGEGSRPRRRGGACRGGPARW